MRPLNSGERDTLVALIEGGPLWDGDVPSKTGRDELIQQGLAVRVVVRLQDGWTAATYKGRDVYRELFPDALGQPADSVSEARFNRLSEKANDRR